MRYFLTAVVLAVAFFMWLFWVDYVHGEPRTVFDYDRLYEKHCICIRDGDKPNDSDDCDCVIDGEHEFSRERTESSCEKRVHE